jgi:hypothetical protein
LLGGGGGSGALTWCMNYVGRRRECTLTFL